jgi:photosystem II protein
MNIRIEFIKGISETTLPIIKLTKSRNGKTGTATFIFINPILFKGQTDFAAYLSFGYNF